jgi:TRAP-type C4-dicarboxylate transport system permease small subunit
MRLLDALDRLVAVISSGANAIGSFWVVVLMLLISADVALRAFANAPIRGVHEIVEISIVAMLFLQITNALVLGTLTRSDALFGWIVKSHPRMGMVLSGLFNVAGMTVMGLIAYIGVDKVSQAYHGGFFIGMPGVFAVPQAPLRAVIVFGCALMATKFLLVALRDFAAIRSGSLPGHLAHYAGAPSAAGDL